MKDTPPDVQARFDDLMRQRSGTERVRMMSEMFDLARASIISDLKARCPDISDTELRLQLFERLYGNDLDPATRAAIVARWRRE